MCLSSVPQVLDWIENHGEAFLSKHTGVGKSLHRARALQKRHEDFEEVAQVKAITLYTCMEINEKVLLLHLRTVQKELYYETFHSRKGLFCFCCKFLLHFSFMLQL